VHARSAGTRVRLAGVLLPLIGLLPRTCPARPRDRAARLP